MELRDAIHEGDRLRILRCWKFMLLYWRHTGHTKYAHEAIQITCAVQDAASEQIVKELVWCRTVNPRGAGNNIPADLYLEHLNRTLKDCLHSVGSNISIQSIVQSSLSRNCSILVHALIKYAKYDQYRCITPVHHQRWKQNHLSTSNRIPSI